MNLWDDQLKFCPKCKATVELPDETKTSCPNCGSEVWFYHYKPLAPPPDIPAPPDPQFWRDPRTALLLITAVLLSLTAALSVHYRLVAVMIVAVVGIALAAYAVLRHKEVADTEDKLRHLDAMSKYAALMRNRVTELANRYNALLQTGDSRVERYFDRIYVAAESERLKAEVIRHEAMQQREAVQTIEVRIYRMAERLINDYRKAISFKLRPDPESYQRRKLELEKMFQFIESVGYPIPKGLTSEMLGKLKEEYSKIVREQALKEEQKRIRRQMQEELKLAREREEQIRIAEEREQELRTRLNEALALQQNNYGTEIDQLRRELAEAHARAERAKSMAQMTKAGHVYILSNIGSFGQNVFKVGMTRRLEPLDRVHELGDASVPFPFDVHAMIDCEDAPSLENALHRELTRFRVNRVNLRKEYFRLELPEILAAVERHHGRIEYVAEPEALEYRDSLETSPDEVEELETELEEMGIPLEDLDE